MLPGSMVVTVEVRIAPLHTMYPAVAWVVLLTEIKSGLGSLNKKPIPHKTVPHPFHLQTVVVYKEVGSSFFATTVTADVGGIDLFSVSSSS
nr:hypothetical protein [Tanacetum cinerariifolium]